MHIPSEMLSGAVCPVTAVVSVTGISSAAVLLAKKTAWLPSIGKFALVSAAVFGLQMLNYPIWNGISGHLIAGVFAAAVLGTPAAVLSMSLVLLLQTLLFADGGILMLGANILNMAVIGTGLGGWIRSYLINHRVKNTIATAIAGMIAVELAVLALCVELWLCGKGTLSILETLIAVHTSIAIFEGCATALLVKAVSPKEKEASSRRTIFALAGIIAAALLISPFASAFPDAFEWTMENFSLLPGSPNFVSAPFADYAVPAVSHETVSGLLASGIGLAATLVAAFLVILPFKFSRKNS